MLVHVDDVFMSGNRETFEKKQRKNSAGFQHPRLRKSEEFSQTVP